MSRFHIGAKDRNKTQICLCQEGLFHILIALYGSQNICYKGSKVLQGLNQPLPVWFSLFTTSPGTACAASSSGTGHQRKQLSPRSTFLGAGMKQVRFCHSAAHSLLWWLPDTVLQLAPRAGSPPQCSVLGMAWECCSAPGDGSRSLSAPSFHGIECFAVSQLHAGLNFRGG